MNRISKLVGNRVAVAKQVMAAGREHESLLARGLEAECERLEVTPPQDAAGMFAAFTAMLEASTNRMLAAEDRYVAERSDDGKASDAANDAEDAVYGTLVRVRGFVSSAFGSEAIREWGMSGTTPRGGETLEQYARNVVQLMRRAPAVATLPGGVQLRSDDLVAEIETAFAPFAAAREVARREQRQTQEAMGARDRAVAEWEVTYQFVAGVLSHGFRLAGRRDLSDRLRPTTRRVTGEDGPAAAAAPAEAAPAPEPVA